MPLDNSLYQKLEKILTKTSLEPYTDRLFNLLQQNVAVERGEDIDEWIISEGKQLAKALLSWLRKEPIKIGSTEITNETAIDAMIHALIDEYREIRSIFGDLDLGQASPKKLLERDISELWNINPKRGRKPKNLKIMWIIQEIQKFYKKHTNKDYRLLFDCLDLFGFIESEVKGAWKVKDFDEAKTQYMKSIYNQALKQANMLIPFKKS